MNLYRAWYFDPAFGGIGALIYENKPNGNLVGDLPAGAQAHLNSGTLTRKDGGDPFEHAIFITPSGRTVIVERQP